MPKTTTNPSVSVNQLIDELEGAYRVLYPARDDYDGAVMYWLRMPLDELTKTHARAMARAAREQMLKSLAPAPAPKPAKTTTRRKS